MKIIHGEQKAKQCPVPNGYLSFYHTATTIFLKPNSSSYILNNPTPCGEPYRLWIMSRTMTVCLNIVESAALQRHKSQELLAVSCVFSLSRIELYHDGMIHLFGRQCTTMHPKVSINSPRLGLIFWDFVARHIPIILNGFDQVEWC